ncbi:ASCH domain-containing protein [Coralloluteibacterium stylophorae]|uniref:ASCH domain-containing protein n=1 Tax=Coralloluteibacterium stylophorae TaxID=1776034 RepID=A0A8J8AYH3_9GAMM|nr:ASCH domain-containing protein [Coralloluteibacterium stylophorae]MBS7455704.1 ASCH domain-containing protein [Coralloluteibacterium stylophorae]
MKGLVIDEPWISLLLRGEKTWEMRSRHTTMRGRIGLIRKGTGLVVGIADVVDSIGPLDAIAWRAHRARHRIPLELEKDASRWNVAWVLESVRALRQPVPYEHPSGAVVWVALSDDVVARMDVAHGTSQRSTVAPPTDPQAASLKKRPTPADTPTEGIDRLRMVPVARDGSRFIPALRRAGGFTIGRKGEEVVVRDYLDALAELRRMDAPRWRRPNAQGNWGIVTGVRWEASGCSEQDKK